MFYFHKLLIKKKVARLFGKKSNMVPYMQNITRSKPSVWLDCLWSNPDLITVMSSETKSPKRLILKKEV